MSQLPDVFINPQQCKSLISFTTESIVKIDQQSQGVLREITLMSNVILQELICTLRTNIGLYKEEIKILKVVMLENLNFWLK